MAENKFSEKIISYRLNLLFKKKAVFELKTIEALNETIKAQAITYL